MVYFHPRQIVFVRQTKLQKKVFGKPKTVAVKNSHSSVWQTTISFEQFYCVCMSILSNIHNKSKDFRKLSGGGGVVEGGSTSKNHPYYLP